MKKEELPVFETCLTAVTVLRQSMSSFISGDFSILTKIERFTIQHKPGCLDGETHQTGSLYAASSQTEQRTQPKETALREADR